MAAKTAGDIMIPLDKYPHIPYWFTIRQAVAEIEKSEIVINDRKSLPRALLVFDEQYHLLGILRRRDILKALEPKFLRTMSIPHRRKLFDIEVDPNLVDLSTGMVSKEIQMQAEHKVSEIMQPIIATADVNDPLAKIIYKMVNRDLTLLPVMKDDKVVGVLRSVDIFQEIANLLL